MTDLFGCFSEETLVTVVRCNLAFCEIMRFGFGGLTRFNSQEAWVEYVNIIRALIMILSLCLHGFLWMEGE